MPGKLAISLSLLLLAAASAHADETGMCPQRIETTQSLPRVPEGWIALARQEASMLSNASFFDGHPDQQAELAPSSSKTMRRTIKNTWKFDSPHNGSIWLRCSYANTSLTLARQLDRGTVNCAISYDASYSPPAIVSVSCK